jgi:hypothetical protein
MLDGARWLDFKCIVTRANTQLTDPRSDVKVTPILSRLF